MSVTTAPADLAPETRRSRRRANLDVPLRSLQILSKTLFGKKTSKNEHHNGTGRSRTQNGTVPEEGKSRRSLTILANFIENDFLKTNFEK